MIPVFRRGTKGFVVAVASKIFNKITLPRFYSVFSIINTIRLNFKRGYNETNGV